MQIASKEIRHLRNVKRVQYISPSVALELAWLSVHTGVTHSEELDMTNTCPALLSAEPCNFEGGKPFFRNAPHVGHESACASEGVEFYV